MREQRHPGAHRLPLSPEDDAYLELQARVVAQQRARPLVQGQRECSLGSRPHREVEWRRRSAELAARNFEVQSPRADAERTTELHRGALVPARRVEAAEDMERSAARLDR